MVPVSQLIGADLDIGQQAIAETLHPFDDVAEVRPPCELFHRTPPPPLGAAQRQNVNEQPENIPKTTLEVKGLEPMLDSEA